MGREVRRVPADWRHPVDLRLNRRGLTDRIAAALRGADAATVDRFRARIGRVESVEQITALVEEAEAMAARVNVIDVVEQADGAYGVPRMLGSGEWDPSARYVPLFGGSFSEALAEWERERALFERGLWLNNEPLPESAKGATFEEWHGERPDPEDYMPDWPESERTHFQMYETCSEGTPISPVFATREDVARWCADNGASAFGDMTMSYEQWLKVAGGEPTVGLMMNAATGEAWPA